jgi:hypothetical protein
VYLRIVAPLLAVALTLAGCSSRTVLDQNTQSQIVFSFAHPSTYCDIYAGDQSVGRVSIAAPSLVLTRSEAPLRLSCAAPAHAPLSAEIAAVRTRDQAYGVLGVNVPTPQALRARVVEPITGPPASGFPPQVTVDIAQRAVLVPDGWEARR